MRAVVFERYGPAEVLQLREVAKPAPKKNEVLVRIRATTVTPSDILLRSGRFPPLFWLPARILYGFLRPRRLTPAYELAGEVEAVGRTVERFKAGDQVFGSTMWRMSCSAEYICLPEAAPLASIPAGLSFRDAVALCDGTCTALHFLRKAGIQKGHELLVYGASGSVGSSAIQLAKHFGARVTGVCSSGNLQLVASLGADEVIDYTRESFVERRKTYDIIFDTVGKSGFPAPLGALAPRGVFVSTRLDTLSNLRGKWLTLTNGRRVVGGFTSSSAEKLKRVRELIVAGALRPVVDRVYRLEQIADAHRYVEEGHKRGNVVIRVDRNAPPAEADAGEVG